MGHPVVSNITKIDICFFVFDFNFFIIFALFTQRFILKPHPLGWAVLILTQMFSLGIMTADRQRLRNQKMQN